MKKNTTPTPVIVLDTNVLVAAAYAPDSASRKIIEAIQGKRLESVISHQLRREYELIIKRAIRGSRYQHELERLIGDSRVVEITELPRVVPEDPDDDMVLATAVAGDAGTIVTNDQHLLPLNPYRGITIARPRDVVGRLLADGSG